MMLVRWAMQDGKPVFGVCRGLQIINLAAGGTLVQDIAKSRTGAIKHDYFPYRDGHARDYLAHEVRIVEGTRLRRILGVGQVAVNSMHHQGVDRLGDRLVASALAPDGLVEGLETPGDGFVVGVQWHPEVLTDASTPMRRLFEEFIAAAREYAVREAMAGVPGGR
jgi:putative glutamine amidotransferase